MARPGGRFPASFAQERIWFLDRLAGGSSAYILAAGVRLDGRLDTAALAAALSATVRRHEVLRTVYAAEGRTVLQEPLPPTPVPLPVVDLSGLPAAAREAVARRLAHAEVRRSFDLATGPLLRVHLLRLAPESQIFVLAVHHIACDGWSIGVLIREVAALYRAGAGGGPALAPLPLQYGDFALWQREAHGGEARRRDVEHWRARLAGSGPSPLPWETPGADPSDARSGALSATLPADLVARLRELAHDAGVTPFLVFLAALGLQLHRLTGQPQVTLGTPVAGRDRAELEPLIGCFLNLLPLRLPIDGTASFRELLARAREVFLEAMERSAVPFEALVEELQPARQLGRTPFFDVVLNVLSTPAEALDLPGLAATWIEMPEPDAKFALTLYVEERGESFHLRFVHRLALLGHPAVEELKSQLERLLAQAVAAPDAPLAAHSLVTTGALTRLPDPSVPLAAPLYPTLAEMFEAWVAARPESEAVLCRGRAWSYAELDAASRRIAADLRARVPPAGVATVCGAPSFGLIAALLAVLRSGRTLLTLDRNHPERRLRQMLELAGASAVLYVGSDRPEDAWLAADPQRPLLRLDLDGAPAGAWPEAPAPAGEESGEAPAYIFFTSGTTSLPKGVLGTQSGLGHFLAWQRGELGVGPGDRAAQITGLSFDVVLRDVFVALVSGAALAIPEEEVRMAPAALLAWMERERITLLHTVPSLAEAWLAAVPPGVSLPSLRTVCFAGEPLPQDLVRRFREAFPEVRDLVNLYGPTETTLAKLFYRIPAEPRPGIQPVGSPLPDTQALIVGEGFRLCGLGEPGEIVIRTPFRSRGYLGASGPDGRFVASPFRSDPSDLLYRTGDLGRYGLDGTLEILGRLDGQMKIRGIRIEPAEIEALLRRHPAVAAAAVGLRAEGSGGPRLAAWIVPAPGGLPTADELRRLLRDELPEAMVPSLYVALPALPLTPNGKLDRAALPDPAALPGLAERVHVPPGAGLESRIAAIWSEALGTAQVGLDDNFFDLGGHSLLLVAVHRRLVEEVDPALSVVDVFRYPTVRNLAGHVGRAPAGSLLLDEASSRGSRRRAFLAGRRAL